MKLKKFYEEPSLDLYKYNFAQIMEGGGDDDQGIHVVVDEIFSRLLCLVCFDDHLGVIDPFDGIIFHHFRGAFLIKLIGGKVIERLADGADDADACFSHNRSSSR